MSAHATHCCKIHFCKYGDDELCPVTIGTEVQEYPCEMCTYEAEERGVDLRPGEVAYSVVLVLRKQSTNEVKGMNWLPKPEDVRDAVAAQMDTIRDEGWYVSQVVE